MKFAEDDLPGQYSIYSYDNGTVTINEAVYKRSLIVMPEQIIDHWQPQSLDELTKDHLQSLAELKPEIVLLGTGPTLRFPPPGYTTYLEEQGIGVEIMDTAAACRTYNVLLSEDRNIAAALLMK